MYSRLQLCVCRWIFRKAMDSKEKDMLAGEDSAESAAKAGQRGEEGPRRQGG